MRHHQSTIFIREDLLKKLTEAVDLLNIGRSKLIETLLIRYLEKNTGGKKYGDIQKYQKIEKGIGREKICMFWNYDIYERSCDVKKLFKKSVSYAIADAIELYLNDIINEIQSKGKAYNYNTVYSVFTKYYYHTHVSITIWGEPGYELLEKIYLFLKKIKISKNNYIIPEFSDTTPGTQLDTEMI